MFICRRAVTTGVSALTRGIATQPSTVSKETEAMRQAITGLQQQNRSFEVKVKNLEIQYVMDRRVMDLTQDIRQTDGDVRSLGRRVTTLEQEVSALKRNSTQQGAALGVIALGLVALGIYSYSQSES